jgi:hypothetical protein
MELQFEVFKAHIEGDEEKARIFSEEIYQIEKSLDESSKK